LTGKVFFSIMCLWESMNFINQMDFVRFVIRKSLLKVGNIAKNVIQRENMNDVKITKKNITKSGTQKMVVKGKKITF